MPEAHSYVQYILTPYKFYTKPGPGSINSAGKGQRVKSEPAHGPPLQARVVAANRTVLTTCDDPGAHGNEQGGQSKIERGQTDDVGSGHGKGGRQAQPAELGRCRHTQPADDLTGTGLEAQLQTIRPVQASQQNNSQQTSLAGLSPCSAGWWRECGGAGTRKAGSDLLTCLPPTFAFAVTVPTHSLNL